MQVNKYMFHGWQNQNMNPDDYMAKLIDYENEDKPLNFIAVSSNGWCNIQIFRANSSNKNPQELFVWWWIYSVLIYI